MPASHRALTRRESQIMEILHRRQRATIEEIREELPDAPSPSSVRKLLDIMIERRLLGRLCDGPRFVYFPIAKPRQAARFAVKQLVRTFFNDSPSSAMAALLDSPEEITEEEYKRLSALLKQARGGSGGLRFLLVKVTLVLGATCASSCRSRGTRRRLRATWYGCSRLRLCCCRFSRSAIPAW